MTLDDQRPTRRFPMTDKITPIATAAASTPSKDTPVEAKITQPGKDDGSSPKAEPSPAPTVKR
jgi:hypothetical protein